MRIETSTKAILTIIAVALVWIAAGGPNVTPAVEAQDRTPARVVIVGSEQGASGGARSLPPRMRSGRRRSGHVGRRIRGVHNRTPPSQQRTPCYLVRLSPLHSRCVSSAVAWHGA